jgi:hypothetical protein
MITIKTKGKNIMITIKTKGKNIMKIRKKIIKERKN